MIISLNEVPHGKYVDGGIAIFLLNEVRLQHDLCVHVESCAIYSLGNQFHFVSFRASMISRSAAKMDLFCLEVWTLPMFFRCGSTLVEEGIPG